MQTIEKLDNTRDFQAAVAASRTLLEITVDMVLLHCDKTNASGRKMIVWGQSARLKADQGIANYYKKGNKDIPAQYKATMQISDAPARGFMLSPAFAGWGGRKRRRGRERRVGVTNNPAKSC